MSPIQIQRLLLVLIVSGYIIIAAAFAIRVPDWQTPDEPAHYNYIAQIAEQGRLPKIEPGDWNQSYLEALTGSRFDPALLDSLYTVQYEDHQPPLFYVLATPVYLLTGGNLTALRLFSAAFGIIIVVCAYKLGLLMFPERPHIGLAAAAFVAFLPQHLHILASVNNDSLAWAIVALTLVASVAYVKGAHPVKVWQLGLLVGLGFITKATTYFLAGLVPLALLLAIYAENRNSITQRRRDTETQRNETVSDSRVLQGDTEEAAWPEWEQLIRKLIAFALPALALGLIWWLRNFSVYGFPDLLGLAEHDSVVVGQPRTAELIDRIGWSDYLREISSVTLNSFVGRFGWMGVPMNGWSYTAVLGLMAAGVSGLVPAAILSRRDDDEPSRSQYATWLLLMVTIALSVLAYLYYNIEFQQHQGRYLYPMLIPLGILLALGIDGWRRLLLAPLAGITILREHGGWVTVLPFLMLASLSLWLLWRVIVPNLEIIG